MKSFAELARLRDALKEQALRDSAGAPPARGRAGTARTRGQCVPRRADRHRASAVGRAGGARSSGPRAAGPAARAYERAALIESLSDYIDVDVLLSIHEELSFRRQGIGPDVVRLGCAAANG